MNKSLIWLTAGAFAAGTEGFVVAGILPAIASDFDVSIAAAGQIVTVFAITYAISSPISSVLTSTSERKILLIVALAGFAIANILACVASTFEVLILARVLQAIAAGAFSPAASAYIASVAPPGRKGRALTAIALGGVLATLAGAPLGTILGNAFGWRATYLAIAILTIIALTGLTLFLARLPGNETASMAARIAVIRNPNVVAVLLVTTVGMIGAFSVYTYIAPLLQHTIGFTGNAVAGVLLAFGVGGAFGAIAGGIACDRWGPRATLSVVLVVLAIAFATLVLGPLIGGEQTSAILSCVAVAVWGMFGWSFPIAQQMRLVLLEPNLSAVALSLNASATYFGISIGAALGGLVVSNGAVINVAWMGAAFQILALLILRFWSVTPDVRCSAFTADCRKVASAATATAAKGGRTARK
jgi:predicted MFS family arabinose efflux permease